MKDSKIDINRLLKDIEFNSSFMDDCNHEQWTTNREGLDLYRNMIDLVTYIKELEERVEKLENSLVIRDMYKNNTSWYSCIKDYSVDNKIVFEQSRVYQVTDQDEYYVYVLDAKNSEHELTYDEMKEYFKI